MHFGLDASRAVTDQHTGTEAYAKFLIEALIPHAAAKAHQLTLYFNQPPPPNLFPQNDAVQHAILPARRLWTHGRLGQVLRRQPPDVFFTPAHVIPVFYRHPSIATVHDLGYHYFPEAHTRQQVAYLRWSTRQNGRSAHTVLADSQATKNDLIRFYKIPAKKIEVVYPGLDAALAPVADRSTLTAVCQTYGIRAPYLLFLSTLQPRKNVSRLIRAYARSKARHTHQLVLAGKVGWLSGTIQQTIARQPAEIAKKIILTGFVANDDKAALLSGATTLLYPSLYEGFGFPLLEAQACKTAVLTANTSSLPELAADSALLVDPLNEEAITAGIDQLVDHVSLRETLIIKGLQNIERFDWQKTAKKTLTILETAGGKHL